MSDDVLLSTLAKRRILLACDGSSLQFRAPKGSLDAELRDRLRLNKDGLVSALRERPGFVQLCPLSYNQLSLFFTNLLAPESAAYNLALSVRLRSPVESARMQEAFGRVVARHEQLRTTYGYVQLDDVVTPCQFVAESLPPTLEEFDARCWNDRELHEQARTFYQAPLNLETGPIVRGALFTRADTDRVLVLKLPHIAADGWSLRIVARDLSRYYREACGGEPSVPEAHPAAYTEYALEQHALLSGPDGQRQVKYWQHIHTPPALPLELGTRERRPSVRRPLGATRHFEIDTIGRRRIEESAKSLKVTTFALLLAAFEAFLMRRSAQNDLVVGIPTLGQRGQRFDDTVGYFVNPVALRSRRQTSLSFAEHARLTAQEVAAALEHRHAPFSAVAEQLGGARDPSRTPLFQVMFTLLTRRVLGDVADWLYPSAQEAETDFGGLVAAPFPLDQQEGQFDLTLEFVDRGAGLSGLFKYCTDLFTGEDAGNMVRDFLALLDQATSDPDGLVVVVGQSSAAAEVVDGRSRIVLAATFTADAMQDSLEFWFDRLGWSTEAAFAPFNQVYQSLLDPSSLLRQNGRGFGVVLVRLDDLLGHLVDVETPSTDSVVAAAAERLGANLDELARAVEDAAHAMSVPLCVAVCPSSPHLQAILSDEALLRQNFEKRLASVRGVHTLTPEVLSRWYPVKDCHEPLGEELGHIPYTSTFLVVLATGVVRMLHAATRKSVKALVVDCDGTLWDGVAGEDGPEGVVIGTAQQEVQEFLLEQAQAGVVLCLCSKNQEADVWSVLDAHPNTKLRRDHFPFWRINWRPKPQNLRELAAEIDVGIDTLAFLDDSPIERDEVRANCPSVLCADLPEAWAARVPYLRQLWPLDQLRVTEEDRRRNQHYRSERLRSDLRRSVASRNDFFARLELQVDIRAVENTDYDRLAQLTVRTNQFNTTVRRMTAQDVAAYVTTLGQQAFVVRVCDRFGDYGLVGAMLTASTGDCLEVEAFMLSCRALGRGVEYRMAVSLADWASAEQCRHVEFPVLTTDRNEPARAFLGKLARLCDGDVSTDGTLRVRSERLATVQHTDERDGSIDVQNVKPAGQGVPSDSVPGPWDPGLLAIASELGTVDAILSAVAERRQRKRGPPRRPSAQPGRAPTSDTERTICSAWQRVLSLGEIGTEDNFFEVGGTSILLAEVAVQLQRQGFVVSIVELLQYPTIMALADYLTRPTSKVGAVTAALRRQQKAARDQQLPASFERLRRHRGK